MAIGGNGRLGVVKRRHLFSNFRRSGLSRRISTAATVLADDPIFGRFCFGGEWQRTTAGIEVIPKDGVRRRLQAILNSGRLHLTLSADRFAASQPIVLQEDLSELRFSLICDDEDGAF
jgi:hypothetical protein